MNIKNQLICFLIVAILSLCTFNNVAAAPVSKLTLDTHSNYAEDVRRDGQQTYLLAAFYSPTFSGDATAVTMGGGQSIPLMGILSYGTPLRPPSPTLDYSHGIPNAMVNIKSALFRCLSFV